LEDFGTPIEEQNFQYGARKPIKKSKMEELSIEII
jgi:hypothetical protein